MIRPKIEEREDNNGKYIRFHLIGLGRCSFDVTEKGEMDLNCDMSDDELREARNAIEHYFLTRDYGKCKVKESWND